MSERQDYLVEIPDGLEIFRGARLRVLNTDAKMRVRSRQAEDSRWNWSKNPITHMIKMP